MLLLLPSAILHRLQRLQLLLLLLGLAACYEEDDLPDDAYGSSSSGNQQPSFLHDQLTVNVSVQKGATAYLHCCISGLNDQSVSWYKRKGGEIHLLTVGFQTYHNDDRFSLKYEHPNDWRLRIRFVQDRDEGTYQCQVSTHPPMARTIRLHVVVPAIEILDDRGVVLREKFYRAGSTIELQCMVADVPTATSLQLAWYHGNQRLNYDDRRGGVSVKTELRGSVARSWLRVSDARKSDSGVYYCNVTELSATGITIHVVADEYPAAIQEACRPVSTCRLALLAGLAALAYNLLCWPCR